MITPKEKAWIKDIKRRCIRDYKRMDHGTYYEGWETWKLCELVERLAKKK